MDNELDKYIELRCDDVLQRNERYIELQEQLAEAHSRNDIDKFSEISYQMQYIAVITSYKLALKDRHYVVTER